MDVGKGKFADLVLLIIPFFGLVWTGLALDTFRPTENPWRPPTQPPKGERTFLDGGLAAGFAEDREIHSRLSHVLRPWWNEALYWGAREVNEKVVVGEGNWLFWNGAMFIPEVTEEQRRAMTRQFAFAGQARAVLAERGVGLIAIVTPDKARIYPEKAFGNGKMPDDVKDLYGWYVRGLHDQGIPTLDIEARLLALRAERPDLMLYGPSDTHWHDPAIKPVAAEIAKMAYDLGYLSPADADPAFRDRYEELTWRDDETTGNLARMANLIPNGPAMKYFSYERPRRRLIEKATGETVRNMKPAEVFVLGTSFTAEESFDFPQTLAMELGRPVEFRWRPGAEGFRMIDEFLRDEADIATRRLVIWEISLGI